MAEVTVVFEAVAPSLVVLYRHGSFDVPGVAANDVELVTEPPDGVPCVLRLTVPDRNQTDGP